jgi:FlaA1/EpsC-like NDP-sugar epimerase
VTLDHRDLGAEQQPQEAVPVRVPWTRSYVRGVVLSDVISISLAGVLAVLLRFGNDSKLLHHTVSYYVVAADIGMAWLASLALGRCYEMRFLAEGAEEYKRVGGASLRLFGLLGFLAFASKTDVARGFVLLFLPLGITGLMLGRWTMRTRLARVREHGRSYHRVLVVGNYATVHELVTQLENDKRHGFRVVGACVSGTPHGDTSRVHVVGGLGDVRQVVKDLGVDTVAVAGSRVSPCGGCPTTSRARGSTCSSRPRC